MALSEFQLIQRFFTRPVRRADVEVGVGDDGAVLHVPAGTSLVCVIDTLVEGQHFSAADSGYTVGRKCVAVNLSDLAAMGAEPAWATLAMTLPESDEQWLTDFARGFFEQADAFGVELVGGDTTKGPRTITVQLHGLIPRGGALRRGGARPGDRIYVSGTVGDAAAAWLARRENLVVEADAAAFLDQRLDCPSPRVVLGMAVRDVASAAIDISDGLCADLGHILECSGVGARIDLTRLPLSSAYRRVAARLDTIACEMHHQTYCWPVHMTWAMSGGDDYELCFTAAPEHAAKVQEVARAVGCAVTEIGEITSSPDAYASFGDDVDVLLHIRGYQHF